MLQNYSNDENLVKIIDMCCVFTTKDAYVYKICNDIKTNETVLVIMKKLKTTITNEFRFDVSKKDHAKFRANKLKVVMIINILKPDSDVNNYVVSEYDNGKYVIKTMYKVNEIVIPDKYDKNLNNICSNGLHYFKTIIAAYYYREIPKVYTGHWIEWHDNGEKLSEGDYLNGKKVGDWSVWHNNGHLSSKGEYVSGEKSGFWQDFFLSGQVSSRGNFIEGKRFGYWVEWHDNIKKKASEGCYVNGKRSGRWKEWERNGKMMCVEYEDNELMCTYSNDKDKDKFLIGDRHTGLHSGWEKMIKMIIEEV